VLLAASAVQQQSDACSIESISTRSRSRIARGYELPLLRGGAMSYTIKLKL
jgi:hypothetical protein